MDQFKKEIIEIGRWIWEKDLTAAASGNISVKVGQGALLITGHDACLGMLKESDIGEIDLEGEPKRKGFQPSTEKMFHASVHKNLNTSVVLHVHPTYTNGYFAANDSIEFDTFETRLTFGEVPVIVQKTPAITDISAVVEALKRSNIVVLKHHGVVAIGESLKDAFFLIQALEEAVKIACIKDLYMGRKSGQVATEESKSVSEPNSKKYKLFSPEQIKDIVGIVNSDEKFRRLSQETALQTKLAVVLEESGLAYCFNFSDGKIADYSNSINDAEFIITGKAEYWRQIFNRQLDPFAATTQKKLKLKGDFAKISRWYVPFNRLFELWKNTPVE